MNPIVPPFQVKQLIVIEQVIHLKPVFCLLILKVGHFKKFGRFTNAVGDM
jgi:hypothetical protein